MPIPALIIAALAQVAGTSCIATTKPVGANEVVDAANTVAIPCGPQVRERKLRYDRHSQVVRAHLALAAGEPLGRVFLPSRPAVLPGDRVSVTLRVGPITVARETVALQSARAGKPFFVRADDGAIFAAPAMAEAQR